MDPTYWSPRSTLDYSAVALYSAGLIALALCIWRLRVVHTPAVSRGGAAATLLTFPGLILLSQGMAMRSWRARAGWLARPRSPCYDFL